MHIPYKRTCLIINDECLCDETQKKLCSHYQLVPDTNQIKENFHNKIKKYIEIKNMNDTIEEFIKEQKLKSNTEIKIIKEDNSRIYTTIEKVVENFYKFLKKKSYVK